MKTIGLILYTMGLVGVYATFDALALASEHSANPLIFVHPALVMTISWLSVFSIHLGSRCLYMED